MNVLLIMNSNDSKIKWNAVRFGNFLLNEGEDVSIFLNGPGSSLYEATARRSPSGSRQKCSF